MASTDLDGTKILMLGREDTKLLKSFLDCPTDFVITPAWARVYEKVKEVAEDTTIPVPFGSDWPKPNWRQYATPDPTQPMVLQRDSGGDDDRYIGAEFD